MDIREITSVPAPQPGSGVGSGARTQGAEELALASGQRSDRAEVSAFATSLSGAIQLPEVRQDRVAALQQQISAGTYAVPGTAVADALLRSYRAG